MKPAKEPWHFPKVEQLSTRLLETLRSRSLLWFLQHETLTITSSAEAEHQLKAARAALRRRASEVSPEWALPILLEAIGRAYYSADPNAAEWILTGPSLKLSVSAIWPNIFSNSSRKRSLNQLISIVGAAAIVDQLEAIYCTILAFGMNGRIVFDSRGPQPEGPISDALNSVSLAFSSRGKIFRLANETTLSIHSKAFEVLPGIYKALDGESPSNILELQGTWLSKIEQGDNPKFWEGLANRLNLWITLVYLHAHEANRGIPFDGTKVCLFGESIVGINLGDLPKTRAFWTKDLFWSKEWLNSQNHEHYRNLIAERPVMRVASQPATFCTSLVLVGDSINAFVEACVGGYPGLRNAQLHPKSYRALLSQPFEQEIQALFEKAGFQAGRVNENGVWQTGRGDINLSIRTEVRPPGEIDVLAIHPDGWLMVSECKVLAIPSTDAGFRNLVSKLGEDDPEAIRSKLTKKLAWVRSHTKHLIAETPKDVAFIILDRPWPGRGMWEDIVILETTALGGFLKELGLLS